MRSNGKRATEWPDAEYHAIKTREAALGGKSDASATKGPRKAESASTALETDFRDEPKTLTLAIMELR